MTPCNKCRAIRLDVCVLDPCPCACHLKPALKTPNLPFVLPPLLVYQMDAAPEHYAALSDYRMVTPSDEWLVVVPITMAVKLFLEESLPGLPENYPATAFSVLRLPFSDRFGKTISCRRISKPGLYFTHDGKIIAGEALVFFGRQL